MGELGLDPKNQIYKITINSTIVTIQIQILQIWYLGKKYHTKRHKWSGPGETHFRGGMRWYTFRNSTKKHQDKYIQKYHKWYTITRRNASERRSEVGYISWEPILAVNAANHNHILSNPVALFFFFKFLTFPTICRRYLSNMKTFFDLCL